MTSELTLNTQSEVDRFLLLVMNASIEFADDFKRLARQGFEPLSAHRSLMERYGVSDAAGIYRQAGAAIEDGEKLSAYLQVMFGNAGIEIPRLRNFGQLSKAVMRVMISTETAAGFNSRLIQCWVMAQKDCGNDIGAIARRKLYDRIAVGEGGAFQELNDRNQRLENLAVQT